MLVWFPIARFTAQCSILISGVGTQSFFARPLLRSAFCVRGVYLDVLPKWLAARSCVCFCCSWQRLVYAVQGLAVLYSIHASTTYYCGTFFHALLHSWLVVSLPAFFSDGPRLYVFMYYRPSFFTSTAQGGHVVCQYVCKCIHCGGLSGRYSCTTITRTVSRVPWFVTDSSYPWFGKINDEKKHIILFCFFA